MRIKIITKKGLLVEEEVGRVILPAGNGRMEVLPSHAPTFVLLTRGEVGYDGKGLKIFGGIARIYNDEVLLLTEGVST